MRKKIFVNLFAAITANLLAAAVLLSAFFYILRDNWLLLLLAGVVLLAGNLWLSAHLARKITESISRIDFDAAEPEEAYDELTRFIRTILRQRTQITENLQKMEAQNATVRSIIDHMQEGFVMLGQGGTVLSANPQALAVFGAPPDCQGKNVIFLTRNMAFINRVKAVLQGHAGQMTLELGLEATYHISFIPAAERGALILITDITERQFAEKMRREFSANVSHELKTPLTAIAGFAEIMATGMAAPDDVSHFAQKISDECQRMIDRIENILFLSKLDEMEGREAFAPCDLAEIAAEALDLLQLAATEKQVALTLAAAPCVLAGNRLLLYEMCVNLIANAIQYNRPGGTVKAAVSLKDGTAYLTVADTGLGIPKDEQHRVFERFYRVEPSRGRKTGGTGLGLSIVKHIVRYHRGTIQLESKVGEGTQVYVKLPV